MVGNYILISILVIIINYIANNISIKYSIDKSW